MNEEEKRIFQEAEELFLRGVQEERKGQLYDAVLCYKRAIQLVPDIEFHVSKNLDGNDSIIKDTNRDYTSFNEDDEDFEEEENDDDNSNLSNKFFRIMNLRNWIYFDPLQSDHCLLNNLPVEVVLYILRWVISSDLDIRSLDILSSVSKGFYLFSRDEQLWKMACEKCWPDCIQMEIINEYSSYREMFLERPRIRFDGVYITKISYIRAGEHSFQDQSYRPWHLIEYYRYLRFFSNGKVYFLTNNDPPNMTVSGLREEDLLKNKKILTGSYIIEKYREGEEEEEELVSIIVKKNLSSNINENSTRLINRGNNNNNNFNNKRADNYFYLQFKFSKRKRKSNSSFSLKWHFYGIFKSKDFNNFHPDNENLEVNFKLNPEKFPNFYFSRVKSYCLRADKIL